MLGTATKLQTARTITLSGAVKGSASFNGSGNITITTTQANIAVIAGTIPQADKKITLNYPTGFSKENCCVISIMFYGKNSNSSLTTGATFDSTGMMTGGYANLVNLNASSIVVRAEIITLTSTPSISLPGLTGDVDFKLILMKIS